MYNSAFPNYLLIHREIRHSIVHDFIFRDHIVSTGLRSIFTLLDSVGHIGSAVRAAEEFERSRGLRKADKSDLRNAHSAAAGIPL
ncbi:hypothetical protein [Rhizobium mayense]|uniref:DUF86 domain-containing protein n=1 Tax=Rhizobium mayense TaxID=1312184 RepID=A0ABT7K155_9HYPH|nr:hypothetical protein [Rhizobium mayense]MDL2402339.1 hypothetical protein [Rhizobium mayense]